MAFPTIGILDDFNRADSGTLGASWTADVINLGLSSLQIVSNAASTVGGFRNNWWNGTTFGPDVEVTTTIKSTFLNVDDGDGGWAGTQGGLYARLVTPGTAGADGYYLFFFGGEITGYWAFLQRVDNGVFTTLGATYTGFTVSTDDKFGISVVGSTLTFYRKPAAGSWAQVSTTRTDTTYSAAGYIGLQGVSPFLGTEALYDDFGGGTVVAGAAGVMLPMGMLGTSRV